METEKKIFIDEIRLVWKEFCELHSELYEMTCNEYALLIKGRIDSLNIQVREKIKVISRIKFLEMKRKEIINKMNVPKESEGNIISNASELLEHVRDSELGKYHDILVDMINKIKNQNKKNQVFINKAMYNLRTIKIGVTGKKETSLTYGSNGETKTLSREGGHN